jgi:hypothetical protein
VAPGWCVGCRHPLFAEPIATLRVERRAPGVGPTEVSWSRPLTSSLSLSVQARQALAGQAPTDASTMFLDGAFQEASDNQKLLGCSPLEEEAKIKNHTCVCESYPFGDLGALGLATRQLNRGLSLSTCSAGSDSPGHPGTLLPPSWAPYPAKHGRGPARSSFRASLRPRLCFATFPDSRLSWEQLMDVGVIDVNTCQPVPNVLVDLWHANTTGHYAGHADPDPELFWEGPAPSGIRKGLLTKFPRCASSLFVAERE